MIRATTDCSPPIDRFDSIRSFCFFAFTPREEGGRGRDRTRKRTKNGKRREKKREKNCVTKIKKRKEGKRRRGVKATDL